MSEGVLDTFWCGIMTGSLWAVMIYSMANADTISAIVSGAFFAMFVALSVCSIRKTSKQKTVNQIIIRHLTEKDMTDELKKLAEVD